MTERDRLDQLLAGALPAQLETLADDGFSATVVRRVRQRKSLRVLALSLASFTGLLIALAPAGRLIGKLETVLAGVLDDLQTSGSAGAVGTLLEALQVREGLTALSDQIMGVFTLSGDPAWLAGNETVVMSTLLGLAATAALRLFVR